MLPGHALPDGGVACNPLCCGNQAERSHGRVFRIRVEDRALLRNLGMATPTMQQPTSGWCPSSRDRGGTPPRHDQWRLTPMTIGTGRGAATTRTVTAEERLP
jgi:hypothetical protein